MESGATGEHEDRTQVICHLPLNSAAEEKAFKDVVAFVEAQRRKKTGLDGYTYSDPKAFLAAGGASITSGCRTKSCY